MSLTKNLWIAALGLALVAGALADDTNVEAETKKEHGAGLSISFDSEDHHGSKKAWEKLTPEQIFELEKIKAQHPDDITSQTPLILAIIFACPVAIVLVILIYRYRRNQLLHRTLAAMIDKGVPIPPELLQPEKRPKSDLQRGLTLAGVGLGLIIFFAVQHEQAWGLGFIPLLMGVGYLIAWKLARKNGNG
jgi:hypothetical protein